MDTVLSDNELFDDACVIIEQAHVSAYRHVNETLIKRNWLLGMRIQHEVLKDKRAGYGEQVIKNLSIALVNKYGRGFQVANLYHFIAFYNCFPNIFYAVSRKSDDDAENIFHAVSGKCCNEHISNILQSVTARSPVRLSWTHYRIILQEQNPTIGLLLCADTDEDVAHYSVLNGSDQLFAVKYLTYMPTQDELRRDIEQQ